MYKNKYDLGQEVFLFDSRSGEIESDYVYGVLFVPIGGTINSGGDIRKEIEAGNVEVREQYQTTRHQIVDGEFLFGSVEECKAFYRELFRE